MEMTPDEWEKVKVLFDAALDKPREQRLIYLANACKDGKLRAEVARLLINLSDAGSFLSKPAPIGRDRPTDAIQSKSVLSAGNVLGDRFRIIEFLARGGMGEVYKAEDQELQELVAIKLVRPELLLDPNNLQRFKREVHLAKTVTHPNVCRTFDFFRHRETQVNSGSDTIFVSMELLDGETLSQYLRSHGPLTPQEALPLVRQIAVGMCAAHSVGIVHRDFKPGNIILVDQGTASLRAVITDFGLALRSGGNATTLDTALTATHAIVGTPAYMAPEQMEGREVTAAADIYAFGLIMYEMLTGSLPFSAETPLAMAYRRVHEPAPSPRAIVPDLDCEWETVILRCLERDPVSRPSSASEAVQALDRPLPATQPASGINLPVLLRQSKRPKVAIPILLTVLLFASFLTLWILRTSRARWARDEAVPQVGRLIGQQKIAEAYALALHAERYIPHDPALVRLWPAISWSGSIRTTPPGVMVFRKNYSAPDNDWILVGRTPIENQRYPLVDSKWRFELKGLATVERATFPSDNLTVTMDAESKVPAGMIHIGPGASASLSDKAVTLLGIPGFERLPAVQLDDYWIDKFEVTNAEFKRFLDQGGYSRQEYWKFEFRNNGHLLSWAEAMRSFHDRTGRPGPATWVQGEYPHGEENFPVTGVSWFEAAAYAEFTGKSLPTIYHWSTAASPQDGASIIPASNFAGAGPAPVGTYGGMSSAGAFDMAGNVKEWISNEANPGQRFIMGGAWNEPSYLFNNADARSPFDRFPSFGFRCVKYVSGGGPGPSADPVRFQVRDYAREKPVSDQLFQVYKSLYSYDKTPLQAAVESNRETDDWKQEKITFNAAYGNERLSAYLYLPKRASPPFQTVVFFPGANAIRSRSSENSPYLDYFDFVLKSGRAVMFPLYKGTFERGDGLNNVWPNTSSTYRDHVIAWSKDLGRSIDFLETRPDIDHNHLAYEALSWGAAMGALLPAVEDRFKALVLIGPGFYLQNRLPEVDQINFAPRVKAPALMLNGRFDFIYPVESSQEPMFRLLGTPKDRKRHVLYDTGHDIPRNEMIKETLDWLDRYLGPLH